MADYAQNNALVLNESGVSHDLDRNKKVKSVTFKTDSYSWPTILAISKTGYNVATDISTTVKNVFEKEIQGIYTINGIKLNAPQKGINIIRYTDGTAKKVIIR